MGLGLVLLLLAQSAAATQLEPRIIGGKEADPGEFPWQVALVWAGAEGAAPSGDDIYYYQFCGGSLIAPDWVVTAAHCVDGERADDIFVVAGIHDLKQSSGAQVLGLEKFIIHGAYNDSALFDNDIALLKLKNPATCSACAPISVVTSRTEPDLVVAGSTTGIAIGWGDMSDWQGVWADTLQKVELPVLGLGQCPSESGYLPGEVTENMLCAGDLNGGIDACRGDSGGSFFVPGNDGISSHLAGIVSWGEGCARENYPGVYARVSCYGKWISDATARSVEVDYGDFAYHNCAGFIDTFSQPSQKSSGGGGGLGPLLPFALLTLLAIRRRSPRP